MTAEEKIASLEHQLNEALERLKGMTELLAETQEQLQQAQVWIAELEKQKSPAPAFVKANKKKPKEHQRKPRKKREAHYNHARRRALPTQVVEHRIVNCPDCHLRLGGISLARSREIIDVPPPPAVEVTEHRIYKDWCSSCQKWHEALVDFSEQVLGQGRIGVRLASMIAYLRTVMRLPLRQLRDVLRDLHGFEVSVGELVELQHRISEHAHPLLSSLKAEIRASPAVQADETGWREDGINGYIWSACTPSIRYDEYHHSRSGEVVKQLIGENFQGVLGSDFYAGYKSHQGLHQRCWVHFLRDIHELKEDFPQDEALQVWAKQVKAIYEQAVAWVEQDLDPSLPHANSTAFAWHSNTPLSSTSGSSASPMPTRALHNTPYVNGSNSFYPNSLSSWRCLEFLPTITWLNEACALWSSLARSAAAHAVLMAHRRA